MSGLSTIDRSIDNTEFQPYQPQQLTRSIQDLRRQKFSGYLFLAVTPPGVMVPWQRVLTWHAGEIVYGSAKRPQRDETVARLMAKCNPTQMQEALQYVRQAQPPLNMQQAIDSVVASGWIPRSEVEKWAKDRVTFVLEQILPFGGQWRTETLPEGEIRFSVDGGGFEWNDLIAAVNSRQQYWAKLLQYLPSMAATPVLKGDLSGISDENIRTHLQRWATGELPLIEIAAQLDRDALQIARSYIQWAQQGLVTFRIPQPPAMPAAKKATKARILSVDDSPIVQKSIERAIGSIYDVTLTNDAVTALHILSREPIDFLLLDVSMPGIDGLELCQTIRGMQRFVDLPIVMLTARDKSYDRSLGLMVGATDYLTKPFDGETLTSTIIKYLPVNLRSANN
jgi:twitching motility two-component system response regulator PilG